MNDRHVIVSEETLEVLLIDHQHAETLLENWNGTCEDRAHRLGSETQYVDTFVA